MNATLNSKIRAAEGEFIVFTKSGGLFFNRHARTSVMPFEMERFVDTPGFQVRYTTSDARILAEWHEVLCRALEGRSFSAIRVEFAKAAFRFPAGKEYLAQYVKGIL